MSNRSLISRISYYRRVLSAYARPSRSQLSFWHDAPEVNENAPLDALGEYYMAFLEKADYAGPFDADGVPLLDYRGRLGRQYNPIAIAQYALGNHSRWKRGGGERRKTVFFQMADWLAAHLEQNEHGLSMWHHHFDWEYRDVLKAPWYSGLAQGQGVSVLVRAHQESGDSRYLTAATRAFEALVQPVSQGGTLSTSDNGDVWIEEYLVTPPTHVLNGFIWALWGVRDFGLATGDKRADSLFERSVESFRSCLARYDTGYWSLYEISGHRLPMLASPFYHRLHIAQLRCMHRLTNEQFFDAWADRWQGYEDRRLPRLRALGGKLVFKALYY